jgi:hypothetical protein
VISTLAANTRGTYTKDGITLNDAVSEASNTFSVSFTPTRYRNQKQYFNATVAVRDAIDLSRTEFYIVEREAVFAGDGGAANNLGKIYANTTVLRVSNTTVNSEISTGEVRVGANVNLTTTRVNVGNSSVNTFITSTAIETDGTLTVAGQSTLSGAVAVGSVTTFQTDYVVDVSANADIGSTTGAGVLIYRFTKATYSSGKFEVQVKNGNTQLSELVLAHDGGSNAFVTTYGTVASNGGASPLGTFIANTDTANVNLYLVQTVANSAVKVVAHLIK